LLADAAHLVHELLKALLDPYRPELHYMRGPGPKCLAKQKVARARDFAPVPALLRVRVKG